MKTIKLIIVAALLFAAGCEKPKPKPATPTPVPRAVIPAQRQVLPESRDKNGKLTREPIRWISDGTPEHIQWLHDHCVNVDPIPEECRPFISTASPTPTVAPSVAPSPSVTQSPVSSPSATKTPSPTSTPVPTATKTPTPTTTATAAPTVGLCTIPNLIGTKVKDAQGVWSKAGFTTTVVVTSGAPGHQITTQSLPAGEKADCNATVIQVSD